MEFTGGWKGPYPDESAYSMAARMAMYVITSSHYLTGIRMFEKNRPLAQYLVKPLKRSDLIRWGLEENAENYKRYVLNHSSYPLYGTTLRKSRLNTLLSIMEGEELKDGREKYLTRALGCTWMRKKSLCYCPACAKEEIEKHGEPYWHRKHQLPGVEVCLKHRLKLIESEMTLRFINHRFVPLIYELAIHGFGPETRMEDSFYIELASDVDWLLEHGLDLGGRENLEMMMGYHIHQRTLDPDRIYSQAGYVYGKTIERYFDQSESFLKWMPSAQNMSYLYLIMLAWSMGFRIKEL